MLSKRGQGAILGFTIVAIIIVVLFALLTYAFPTLSIALDRSPEVVEQIFNIFQAIGTKIIEIILLIVSPSDFVGNTDNQAIALSIFLLITLVGMRGLKPFLGQGSLPLLVSIVVGVIASRGLTDTILRDAALQASPITAAALVIGILPILGLSNYIDRFRATMATKISLYGLAAIFYGFFIYFVIEASGYLAWFYAVAIAVLGCAQIIVPYFRRRSEENEAYNLGQYMGEVHRDIGIVTGMHRGTEENNRRR